MYQSKKAKTKIFMYFQLRQGYQSKTRFITNCSNNYFNLFQTVTIYYYLKIVSFDLTSVYFLLYRLFNRSYCCEVLEKMRKKFIELQKLTIEQQTATLNKSYISF